MIIELLLLAVAFFGAWLVLQPTEQFTYARKGEDANAISPVLTSARCPVGSDPVHRRDDHHIVVAILKFEM